MAAGQKFSVYDYPIVVSRLGDYFSFTNVEFGIEIFEKAFLANLATHRTEAEKCAQIAIGVGRMQKKIAERIKGPTRTRTPLPCAKETSIINYRTTDHSS